MTSVVTFENRSLNRNVTRVGLFWGRPADFAEARRPLTWQVILRCPYLWHRTFQIDLRLSVRFLSAEGNVTPDIAVPASTGFREFMLEPYRDGDKIVMNLRTPKKHPYRKVQLVRGGFPVADAWLPQDGSCEVAVSDILTFSPDMTTRAGVPVDLREIVEGTRSFDLHGITSMRVAMQGGKPGPASDHIHFEPYNVIRD
jgi:hypothetical protein